MLISVLGGRSCLGAIPMLMKSKLALFLLGLTGLAVPSAAGAVGITQPAGTLVPVGSFLGASSTNVTVKTSLGNLTCGSVNVQFSLVANSSSFVKGGYAGPGTTSGCFLAGKTEVKVTAIGVTEYENGISGSGVMGLEFSGDLPGGISCFFERSFIPFTYTAGSSSVHLSGTIFASPAACGTAMVSADFKLTSGLTSVTLD